jgi:hypothetical protein
MKIVSTRSVPSLPSCTQVVMPSRDALIKVKYTHWIFELCVFHYLPNTLLRRFHGWRYQPFAAYCHQDRQRSYKGKNH